MAQLAEDVCRANHKFLAYLNNDDMAAMFVLAKSSLPLRSGEQYSTTLMLSIPTPNASSVRS